MNGNKWRRIGIGLNKWQYVGFDCRVALSGI